MPVSRHAKENQDICRYAAWTRSAPHTINAHTARSNAMKKNYLQELDRAYAFTTKLDASFGRLPLLHGSLFTPELGEEIYVALRDFGIRSFIKAAGQCIKWSHALRPLVEEVLGAQVLLTIGQVRTPTRTFFDPSFDDLERWYCHGFDARDIEGRSGINMHAWWTLPTGEILDVTLWSTLAVAWNEPERLGAVAGGWPDKIAPNLLYVPMVVGDDYIEKVERRMAYGHFLARGCTVEELEAASVIGTRCQ